MIWLFGYGSLIWRPDFPHAESRRAAVSGWRRRFWQASPDHRGVPGAPGRVVTLVEDPGARCYGVAFLVEAAARDAVFSTLDHREKNGYERVDVTLDFDDGGAVDGVTYVAGPGNPSYVGPAPLPEMAAQIASAHGPSGPNLEYLMRLAESLDALDVHDDEVHALRAALAAR